MNSTIYMKEKATILELTLNLIGDNRKDDLDVEILSVSFDDISWEESDNWTFDWEATITIKFEITIWEESTTFEVKGQWSYMNQDTYDISFIEDAFHDIEDEIKNWTKSL